MDPNRREFLAGIGGVAGAFAFGTAGASAQDDDGDDLPAGTDRIDNEDGLPIYAEGTMIHRYESGPEEGLFEHRRTFRSADLYERYGDSTMIYEPDLVPEQAVPDDLLERDAPTRVQERRIIGTRDEHEVAEEQIAQAAAVPDATDCLPSPWEFALYHYASSDDVSPRYEDRLAPINVAWGGYHTYSDPADAVRGDYESNYGGSDWDNEAPDNPLGGNKRYINVDGSARPNATEIEKDDGEGCGIVLPDDWSQYHVRIYEYDVDGDASDPGVEVVGQAHRDPCDHNQVPGAEDPWRFAAAADEVVADSDGDNDYAIYAGNTHPDWDTHDGYIEYVTPYDWDDC